MSAALYFLFVGVFRRQLTNWQQKTCELNSKKQIKLCYFTKKHDREQAKNPEKPVDSQSDVSFIGEGSKKKLVKRKN